MLHTESQSGPVSDGQGEREEYEISELIKQVLTMAKEHDLEIVVRFRRETPSAQRLVLYAADILTATEQIQSKLIGLPTAAPEPCPKE